MKSFIIYLLIIFSFQSWTKADDIKEFEIEGMSIGDSTLDFLSEKKIKKYLQDNINNYKSDKILQIEFPAKSKSYESISLHYKNDGTYEIVNVGGRIIYENNIKECKAKLNEVTNEIENQLPLAKKVNKGKIKYSEDPTGKSYRETVIFELEDGEVYISCVNWSKHIEDKFKWYDHFAVELDSAEFLSWLYNEAY